MKKTLFLIPILFGLLFAQNKIDDNDKCEIIFNNNIILNNVEVAVSPEKMAIGLAKRKDVSSGMIFIFPKEEILHFWMKGTLVDISIGFLDKEMNLLQINEMKAGTLDIHSSTQKAKYALELERNGFEKLGIKIGDKIESFTCK